MSNAAAKPNAQSEDVQSIVVEDVLPHAPETIWKALTTGELMARWLMAPTGFAAVKGNRFTYKTTPGGAWDGTIHCEVLEVIPNQRFVYAWKGGHPDNVGYGAPLDTVVTFTLAKTDGGTRLRLVHSGFVRPKNDSAYKGMSDGWKKVVRTLGTVAGEK